MELLLFVKWYNMKQYTVYILLYINYILQFIILYNSRIHLLSYIIIVSGRKLQYRVILCIHIVYGTYQ